MWKTLPWKPHWNQTRLVCSTFHQEKEGGVRPQVVHSQAGCQHPGLPSAQREGAADGARHAPATLHPHPAARRDPHPVEGWNRYSVVRSLKVAPFPRMRCKACLRPRARRHLSDRYVIFSPWVWGQKGNWNKRDKGSEEAKNICIFFPAVSGNSN